ncbi:MAG: YjbF family lipoprotein [Sulfitobacter sp.]
MTLRFGILVAAVLALGSCGTPQLQQTALGIALGEDIAGSDTGQFPRFAPLLAAGRGPALNVVAVETGVRGGFLRESKTGNIESWLGNDGVSLSFDRGVLHGTRGIGAGLLTSDVAASANAVLAGRSGDVERIHTFLNANNQAISRAYICTITNNGSETINLDNGPTATRRMTEVCRNIDQEFTNLYWVDTRRGRIVQSQQWSGEFVGDLSITTVYNF